MPLCCTTMEINMRWILVFYIIGSGAGGGPATAEFLTSVDCEAAGRAIHDKWQAIQCRPMGCEVDLRECVPIQAAP
jgi:hypothetical protein